MIQSKTCDRLNRYAASLRIRGEVRQTERGYYLDKVGRPGRPISRSVFLGENAEAARKALASFNGEPGRAPASLGGSAAQ